MKKYFFENRIFLFLCACCILFFQYGCNNNSDGNLIPLPVSTGYGIGTETSCNYEKDSAPEIFSGDISGTTVWSGCQRIVGYIRVKEGAILTIKAGTTILASALEITTLVVEVGGMIQAVGNASSPIVFTSGRAVGDRRRGDWGGIVINGKSQYNSGSKNDGSNTGEGEGNSGRYGGKIDLADNSGRLSYVSISFAGRKFTTENELNGLALGAVGSGTTIDHIHFHQNADDGVEMFGGTVNMKYVISSYNGDDQIDWTSGWQGNLQYALLLPVSGDRGIEGDNNSNDSTKIPNSNPTLRNITIAVPSAQDEGQEGILLRVGTMADIRNLYISGFSKCVKVDGRQTTLNVNSDLLLIQSFLFENCGAIDIQTNFGEEQLIITTSEIWANPNPSSVTTPTTSEIASELFDMIDKNVSKFYPSNVTLGRDSSSDSVDASVDASSEENNRKGGGSIIRFEEANYIGAFNDSAPADWLIWTSFPNN